MAHSPSTGFLMHLLGFDCFMSSKAVNGLARAGHAANLYNVGIVGNCRDLWMQGSELGVEYNQVYKIPTEGLHEAKRRHEREEDEDASVSRRQLCMAKHASMTHADTMETLKTGRETMVRVCGLKRS